MKLERRDGDDWAEYFWWNGEGEGITGKYGFGENSMKNGELNDWKFQMKERDEGR